MTPLKQVIEKRSLELGDSYDDIVNMIRNDDKRYSSLRKLCCFYPNEKRLEYLTESIHPERLEHPDRTPILFLFSNPHPDSVLHGLFLSEPHSRSFWQRLFESNYCCMSPNHCLNLEHWSKSTPEELGQLMLQGKYDSPFLFYFHCLWPIPTNQVPDLKRIFRADKRLKEKVEEAGRKELEEIIEAQQIKHIIVFAAPIFKQITEGKTAPKDWRNLTKSVVDREVEWLNNPASRIWEGTPDSHHWPLLSEGQGKYISSSDVEVYLGLDTRYKNLGKDMERRCFTRVIDMILQVIEYSVKSELEEKGMSESELKEHRRMKDFFETIHYDKDIPAEIPGESLDEGEEEDTEEDE